MAEAKEQRICPRCGQPFEAYDGADQNALCLTCSVSTLESRLDFEQAKHVDEPGMPPEEKKRLAGRTIMVGLLLTAVGVMLAYPVIFPPQAAAPARSGSIETDATGDECIENLQIIETLFVEKRVDEIADIECPATGEPYIVDTDDKRIDCPNPDEHGLSALWIGVGDSVPTAQK